MMHVYEARPRKDKCGQFVIRAHNETLSVATVRVSDPDICP